MHSVQKDKLRVGILIDDTNIPQWYYSMLEILEKSYYAEIVVFVKKTVIATSGASATKGKIGSNKYLLFNALTKLEDKFFKSSPDANASRNLFDLLPNAKVLEAKTIEDGEIDKVDETDVEKIRNADLDVLVRIGFRELKGEILQAARHGIWEYYFGDARADRGGPPGVWETLKSERETGCTLRTVAERGESYKVLTQSWAQKEWISINRNNNRNFWKASLFVPRKLEQLFLSGPEKFYDHIATQSQGSLKYSYSLNKPPGNGEAFKLVFSHYYRWLKLKIWFWFNFEQWILLYSLDDEGRVPRSLSRYNRLTPPKDRFWADPVVYYRDQKYYLFFEELIYQQNNGRAHISLIEMDENGDLKPPEIVLKTEYHLSYPFIFDYKGDLYMIPETMDKARIELHKCVSFPNQWDFVMVLKENVEAVDTTIFEKDGKVWMFTNIKETPGGSAHDELFLFFADDLLTTEWQSHILNPIISDVKSARPAGPLYYRDDKLYRPSQDCSYRYGYSTIINEVLELSTTSYAEKTVDHILPNWSKDVVATHSLTQQRKLSVIDALIQRKK
jgi:hypothetical protein